MAYQSVSIALTHGDNFGWMKALVLTGLGRWISEYAASRHTVTEAA